MIIKRPDLSFIILTWNSSDYIKDCLKSITFSLETSKLFYDIWVVDNGSKDNTLKLLTEFQKRYGSKIHRILLKTNMGTTCSRNLALRQAQGKYICLMDSDVQITKGIIEKLISDLNRGEKIGLAVPKIIYPNGNLQKSHDKFPTLIHKINRFLFLKEIEQKEATESVSDVSLEVDYAISAFWLFKRKLLMTIGFLDEKIFYAPEDVDYCLRIRKGGYIIIFDPCISVVHDTQEISRGLKFNKFFFIHLKGLFYYFMKHRYFLSFPRFTEKK